MTEAIIKQGFCNSFAKMSKFIKFSYVIDRTEGVTYSNFSAFLNGDLNRLSLSACLRINDVLQSLACEIVPFEEAWDYATKNR